MNTEITISLPSEIAANLALSESELSRKTLEALAIEGYREGDLSIGQVSEMLGMSVLEGEEFLYNKGVSLNYTIADFDNDLKRAANFRKK